MLIPKTDRKITYERLLQDGVLVARKDTHAPKHVYLNVPNLHVMMLMKSLKSRELVKENFSWMWHYWYLTPKGIEYLREYLHVEADVVPATMKKPKVIPGIRGEGRPERRGPRRFGDENGEKKVGGAPGGYRPEFRDRERSAGRGGDRFGSRGGAGAGFGRGAPRSE